MLSHGVVEHCTSATLNGKNEYALRVQTLLMHNPCPLGPTKLGDWYVQFASTRVAYPVGSGAQYGKLHEGVGAGVGAGVGGAGVGAGVGGKVQRSVPYVKGSS